MRPTGRLRRGARLETVRAYHFGSHACKPSAGNLRWRRMASRSTTSAIARRTRRCTALGSSTRPVSLPHRSQHRGRAATLRQGGVRRLPRVRHPGARLPEAALRRVRPRSSASANSARRHSPPAWVTSASSRTRHSSAPGWTSCRVRIPRGGEIRLGRITKRGDDYLRTLLVQGAKAAVMSAPKRDDPISRWLVQLRARVGWQKACVATPPTS